MISYRIVERVDTYAYKLDTPSGIYLVFHVSLLRPRDNNLLSSQYVYYIENSSIKIDNHNEYEIKSILVYRRRGKEY